MALIKTVSVFGSARVQPGHPYYQQAEAIGRLLGQAGMTVITGGYGGVMEAASKGARELGGRAVGVTVRSWERSGRRLGPNPYLTELVSYDGLTDRLLHVVKRCDAAVACGGGIGTLSEVMMIWSFVQTGEIQAVPIVLLGDQWGPLLEALAHDPVLMGAHEMAMVRLASNAGSAFAMLTATDWPHLVDGARG